MSEINRLLDDILRQGVMDEPGSDGDQSWRSFIHSPFVALNDYSDEFPKDRPPLAKNERLAFPHPNSLKRAALLVDRVYMPCWADLATVEDLPLEFTFGDPQLDQKTFDATAIAAEVGWPWKIDDPKVKLDHLLEMFLKEPLSRYRTTFPNASFMPINYDVGTPVLPSGEEHAFQGVLNNIPVAIEEKLTWQQVKEFRNDADVRRKYRDLHLWVNSLNVGSERQAADLIGQKLEDYRWAIKKHGVSTSLEAVSSFVSLGALVPPLGGLAAQAIHADPILGAVVGGVVAVAGATAWIAKRFLNLEDIKRGQNREVAYLYDIQKLSKIDGIDAELSLDARRKTL